MRCFGYLDPQLSLLLTRPLEIMHSWRQMNPHRCADNSYVMAFGGWCLGMIADLALSCRC